MRTSILSDKEKMEIGWTEVCVLLISTIASMVAFLKWNFKYWERRNVPYLKPTSFPMGHLEPPWALKKGLHIKMAETYSEIKAKGYKYAGIFTSLRPVFMPVDLELLKCIMIKDAQHFLDRGAYYNEKADPLSANLFRLGGDKWKSLRHRITPTFTSGKMKYMFQTVMDCGNALEAEIDKLHAKKQPVDAKEMAALFTTSVIGSCAFGVDCNVFADPDNEFRLHTRKFTQGTIARAMRIYATLSYPQLCRKLGVRFFPAYMTNFYYDVTRTVMDQRESGGIKRNDFLQLLVDIKNDAKSKEDSFTFEEIAAQAMVFFLAGFEPASSTLMFAFYELARHQEIQDKAREEVRAITQKYGGKITYESILEMTYLSQVFDETVRRYPILSTLERVVTKDYKVPDTDLLLTKGTKVLISLFGIQNDPEYYPEPEKFDPDRFLPENKAKRHVCTYMPFGEGPRICIGLRFGIMMDKIAMALMLKNYRYTLNPKMPEMKFHSKSQQLAPLGDILLDVENVD